MFRPKEFREYHIRDLRNSFFVSGHLVYSEVCRLQSVEHYLVFFISREIILNKRAELAK